MSKTVLVDGGIPVLVNAGNENEENRFVYNLLPLGHFKDKRYGDVFVDRHKIGRMAHNFGRYPTYEVPVKLGHGDGALSPGKVVKVEATHRGLEITMVLDEETARQIKAKQYRYMSAEFDDDYMDKTTGERVGPVLLGAALVNQPANPYMSPLVLADDIDNSFEGGNVPMDNNEAIELLKTQLADMEKKFGDATCTAKELEEKLKVAEDEKEKKEKELSDAIVANQQLMTEKREAEVKAFCDGWSAKGVPPAVLDKVKPILLADNVVKLSDTDSEPFIKVLGDVFEAMPKVTMGLVGDNSAGTKELSEFDTAVKLGEEIASYAGYKKN